MRFPLPRAPWRSKERGSAYEAACGVSAERTNELRREAGVGLSRMLVSGAEEELLVSGFADSVRIRGQTCASRIKKALTSPLTASKPTCYIRDPAPFDTSLHQLSDLRVNVATKQSFFDLCIELGIARRCLRGG